VRQALIVLLCIVLGQGAAVFAAPPAARSSSLSMARVSGREYVSVADWARANGFIGRWVNRQSVLLTRDTTRIVLTVNSCDAEFNGILVRLLFPAYGANGGMSVSLMDLQHTFPPLLSPPRHSSGRIRTICIDPGHGGKDPGYRVGFFRQEKTYTLLLAQELRDQLARAGFNVSLTRTKDVKIELPDRPAIANRNRADLFISLHFNAYPAAPGTIQGAEVYCLTPAGAPSSNSGGRMGAAVSCPGNVNNQKNLFLAYNMQKALTRDLGATDRGVHYARFAVLRDAQMPSVLIEAGFLSHPVEGRRIADAGYRRQMARAIVNGILSYRGVVETQG
jgi:N-acetylmuramoyl-L-alanine amidase